MDLLSATRLPWLAAARERLRHAFDEQRFPHSLLLVAAPGLGAEALADWVAGLLLCQASGARPCGECPSCALLRADSHPDHHRVRLEEEAQQIKVDQIRALIEVLTLQSYRGGYKVGIVESAETLNVNGANAFLKTLEEPTDRTVLVLVTAPSHRLPATIASRCTRIGLRIPEPALAREWLEEQGAGAGAATALALAGGAPLLALEWQGTALEALDKEMRADVEALGGGAADPTLVAERWLRAQPALRLAWLENWITARIRGGLGGENARHTADSSRLPRPLLKPKIRALYDWLDAVRELRRSGSRGLNPQLAWEAVLLASRAALGESEPRAQSK